MQVKVKDIYAYLKQKGIKDAEIYAIKPGIEDCFIEDVHTLNEDV